ncbi:reverse transcriptase family protein [Rhizobium leguminosarum]|uniref:reverse transcriptase family protein n=1 Tax=Rhizobium leguminosarum TaxID=384 RepID=UPI003F9CC230
MIFAHDFRRIESRHALIEALGIDERVFDSVLNFVPPPPYSARSPQPETVVAIVELPAFLRHDIPKRNAKRGHRIAWEPILAMSVYKALARWFETFFRLCLPGYPHGAVFGYRPGRNIRENANAHKGQRFLLSLDVENFFPSITREKVAELFHSLGMVPATADLLARFVTIAGSLPLGLPTSPIISNAIALPVDNALNELAAKTGAIYTRYSDDVSLSSNIALPDFDIVKAAIEDAGFKVAIEKTKRSKLGQAHFVTGLSISDPLQSHIPKAKKRQLRQALHYAKKFGLDDHFRHRGVNDLKVVQREVNRLDGLVKFVSHHEPKLSPRLKGDWRAVLQVSGMRPSFAPRGMRQAPFWLLIDEAEFTRGSTKVLALGLVVTQHIEKIIDETRQAHVRATSDLWADGNVEVLRARGLHFTEATEDVRLAYVKELAKMPFEGYVAMCSYDGADAYRPTYMRLLSSVIRRRLMAAESQHAYLLFEQNNKVSEKEIKECVRQAMAELRTADNRRPLGVSVEFLAKPHSALSPPDFLLGVLGKYLQSKPAPEGRPLPRERLMFERLRDKYRLILDVPTNKEYSRRRPIEPWTNPTIG